MPQEPSSLIQRFVPRNHGEFARALLILLFLFCSVFILSFRYNSEAPTIPDERAYYQWGEIYAEGKLHIPVEDIAGNYEDRVTVSVGSGEGLFLDSKTLSLDEKGRNNDLELTVTNVNGTRVANVSVSLFDQPGMDPQNRDVSTDGDGVARLYNLPFGEQRLELFYYPEEGLPMVLSTSVRVEGGRISYYSIQGSVEEMLLGEVREISLENATVDVWDRAGKPLANASLSVNGQELNTTNENGSAQIHFLGQANFLTLKDDQGHVLADLAVAINGQDFGLSDGKGNVVVMGTVEVHVSVLVRDIVDRPVAGVEVVFDGLVLEQGRISQRRVSLGTTDSQGGLQATLNTTLGIHELVFLLDNRDGTQVPVASVITEKDGEYVLVNRWPPGYSLVLGVFSVLGIQKSVSLVFFALGNYSMWKLGKRAFNWRVAFVATLLFMSSALSMTLVYSRGMADYPATALLVCGLWLFMEGVLGWEELEPSEAWKGIADWLRHHQKPLLFLLLAGMLFSASGTMRYSNVVAVAGPFVYLLGSWLRASWKERRWNWRELKKGIQKGLPFLLGLCLVGLPLLAYNVSYFGSAFNSGYQFDQGFGDQATAEDEANVTVSEPSESFFESYFDYDDESLENLPNILWLLLIMAPVLFSIPFSIGKRWKDPLVLGLLVWAFCVFILYSSMSWVGSWEDETRALEDMRYFLPMVPPACLLLALVLDRKVFSKLADLNQKMLTHTAGLSRGPGELLRELRRLVPRLNAVQKASLAVAVLILTGLVLGGFASTQRQVDNQLSRGGSGAGGGPGNGAGGYQQVSIAQLLASPAKFNGKGVAFTGVLIWSNEEILQLFDQRSILVKFQSGSLEQQLKIPGSMVELKGLFRVVVDQQTESEQKLVELRPNSEDRVVKLGSRPLSSINYPALSVAQLHHNPLDREREVFRVDGLTVQRVLVKDKVYVVKDDSSDREMNLVLDQEQRFQHGDRLLAQGEFRRGKNNQEGDMEKTWEIHLRAGSADRVEKI